MDKNTVTLVGAGCSKELLTLRGLEEIQKADVIVYDDLIDKDILLEAKKGCELIYVGKRLGKHSESQEKINEIIINKANENKYVVRLKGGDSFVFARGGEEVQTLLKENIPFEVIPGVSSCIAAAEKTGIPVTHRGVSQSFTVVTGHTASEKEENYQALAKLEGTLVFLMGLSNIGQIAKKLIENGKDKNTPCSVLSRVYTHDEKRIDGTLENIAQKAKDAKTPAIIVVGEVCTFDFSKTKKLPLSGVSVTVTGTKHFVLKLCKMLSEKGADTVSLPYLETQKRTQNIPENLESFDCFVFTSANGVEIFFESLIKNKIDFRMFANKKFACIGSGSAQKLASYGFSADILPDEYTALSLGKKLCRVLEKQKKILILRSENGSELLTNELKENGRSFADCHIYKISANSANKSMIKNAETESDYIVFASGSSVEAFFENVAKTNAAKIVCIGQYTAETLKKYTDESFLVSKKHTAEDIIKTIEADRDAQASK
ncbi:MAG: uroporphyrinogen-III C-methyltransferase [Acutalibacteraceae bacterium]